MPLQLTINLTFDAKDVLLRVGSAFARGGLGFDWSIVETVLTLAFWSIGFSMLLVSVVVASVGGDRPAATVLNATLGSTAPLARETCRLDVPDDRYHDCPVGGDLDLRVEFLRGYQPSTADRIVVDVGIPVGNASPYFHRTSRTRRQSVANCDRFGGLYTAQEIPLTPNSTQRMRSTTKLVNADAPLPCACLAFCGDRETFSPYGDAFPRESSARDCRGKPMALYGWALMYPAFDTAPTAGSYCNCMNALVPVPVDDPSANRGVSPEGDPLTVSNSLPSSSAFRQCNERAFEAPVGGDFPTGLIVAFSAHYNYSGLGDIRNDYASMFGKSRWCPSVDVSRVQTWSTFDFSRRVWVNHPNDLSQSRSPFFRVQMACSATPPPPSPSPFPPPRAQPPPPAKRACPESCLRMCTILQPAHCYYTFDDPPGCTFQVPGPTGLGILAHNNSATPYPQVICVFQEATRAPMCDSFISEWEGYIVIDHEEYTDKRYADAQSQVCGPWEGLTSPPPPPPPPSPPPWPPFQPYDMPRPPSPPPSPPRRPLSSG